MQELVCPFRSGVRPVFDFGQMDTSANLRRVAALMRRSAPPGRLWTGARQTKTLGEKPASSLQAALVERMSDPTETYCSQGMPAAASRSADASISLTGMTSSQSP